MERKILGLLVEGNRQGKLRLRMQGSGINMLSDLPTIRIGGILTANVTRLALAEQMACDVQAARGGLIAVPRTVIASNGSVIANYHRDKEFRELIDAADIVDPDGMPLVLVSRLLIREPLSERVATTDFIIDASAVAAIRGIRFFFLGARPSVGAAAAAALQRLFPTLEIVGTRHGYFEDAEIPALLEEIRTARTDVLWLGLGSPRQEDFAIRYRTQLQGVGWIRTCGGLFDHLGAGVPRAPKWMQSAGLEWLYRVMLEPRRLGLRYLLTNPAAVYHLLTKTR